MVKRHSKGDKLPTRTQQQTSEAKSLAILKYKLDGLGIFRSQSENDYGIDIDLELVDGEQVTGRIVKIQVKSAKKLKPSKDGQLSVGGIKQSTLKYWCEISFRTSVMAYAVDLTTEKIYATKDLFWQASAKIDGGGSSKSIAFMPDAGEYNVALAAYAALLQACQPTIAEVIAAHTLALRRLRQFLDLLADAFHYDPGTQLNVDDFADLLQASRVLLWNDGDRLWTDPNDRARWKELDYWKWKSEKDGWDGISCFAAQPILMALLPALLKRLTVYKERVIGGKFYWAHRDSQYLALVYESSLPETYDKERLIAWAYDYDKFALRSTGLGAYFVDRARIPAPTKDKRPKKP